MANGFCDVQFFGEEDTYIYDLSLIRININLYIFRFMSIAEQMGRILQRTSISTNIKVNTILQSDIFF